ncbi:MAG TPA: hypothetical protein PKY81_03825 [bacterium]|nr:hypothetical protein [bacterium]HPN30065.1 hypothetical protein [bacterium]
MFLVKLFIKKNNINIENELKSECELIKRLLEELKKSESNTAQKLNLAAEIEIEYSKINNSAGEYFLKNKYLPFYWQDLYNINFRLKNIFDSAAYCINIQKFSPNVIKLLEIEICVLNNFINFFNEYLKNPKYSREVLINNRFLFKQFKSSYSESISKEKIDSFEKVLMFSDYFHNLKIVSEQNEMINLNMNKILVSTNN